MSSSKKSGNYILIGIRGATRILAGLLAIMVLVIFLGEGLSSEGPGNPFRHPLPVQLGFLGMLAIWTGLIVGWKWEGIAAILIISGMMIFHIIQGRLWLNWTFGLFDLAGILFLLCWRLGRLQRNGEIKSS